MKDIQFIEPKTTQISPEILGKTSVDGLQVYQKLLVLILSSSSGAYREAAGTTLTDLLQGANTPSDQILQALGTSACVTAKNLLDSQDAQLVSSVTAAAFNGQLAVTVTLADGQSYTGALIV